MSDRLTRHEIKEDQLVTWSFQVWDWAQRNMKIVVGVIAAIVLLTVGGVFMARSAQRAEGEAGRILAEASTNYWQGNYVRAIQLSDQVLEGYKTTRAANDARRMKGDALFWQGAFDSAATLYQDYLKRDAADSPLRRAVQMSLAFALESKGDNAGAAKLFEELAGKAPDRNNEADLMLCAARAYRGAGQADKARALYEKVASDYKETTFARDAEVMLGEMLAQTK